ncbi:MAG: co-chaperone GroES [Chloroflexi bacterium]|nr:co-chaperone GroES [Chloroflexota bacterium]MBC7315350.1 co-chaperone GroES [Chloroflexota bacterium]
MDKLKLKPLADRVVVQPLSQEEVTSAGIVLPETAKEKPQRGKVIATGPGARNEKGEIVPLDVKVGDEVIFAKYAGTEIKLSTDETILILRESDILAIVEK